MSDDLAALGTQPIAGAHPAGASARYEPEFEKLAAEIAKLESVDGRKNLRWKDVVELATGLLGAKTKDLLVCSYLALGLYQTRSYAGLAAGLGVCRDLLKNFWDTLFPEKSRMRARQTALQWLVERVGAAVAEAPDAGKSDRDALAAGTAALEEITAFAREKFEGEGPDLGALTRAVQEKLDSIPGDDAPPQEKSGGPGGGSMFGSPPPEETQAAPAEALPSGEIESPEAAREALPAVRERLLKIAAVLRGASAIDPLPYRLARSAVWADLAAPAASAEGVTEQAGGDAAFAAEQEKRLDSGDYAPVIADSESRLPSDPFWMDLNHFVHRAMEGLGKPYAAARKAVGDEVARAVRAVPALLELKFADGAPMASEAARMWILHELQALPAQGAVGDGARPWEAAFKEARKLTARKQFGEATALAQKALQGLSTRRDRFLGRFEMARFCLEAGRPELARPLLEALDAETRQFPLEDWEPGLCVELARELWKCYTASAAPEKAQDVYSRLCRLDLSAALALNAKR